MRRTKVILAVMIFTIAMSITAFGEEEKNLDATQNVMTMTDDRESKRTQAQQILDDLYANETDQEIRNMAVVASMTSIFGIAKNVGTQLKSNNGPLFTIGRYNQNPDYFKNSTYMVVSKDMSYGLNAHDLIVSTRNSDEGNFEKLQSVYSAAQELKQLTDGSPKVISISSSVRKMSEEP